MKEVAQLGLSAARHLRDEIYEVRVGVSSRSFRVLFAAEGLQKQVLLALCIFAKTTRRTPRNALEVARTRLLDWRRRRRVV